MLWNRFVTTLFNKSGIAFFLHRLFTYHTSRSKSAWNWIFKKRLALGTLRDSRQIKIDGSERLLAKWFLWKSRSIISWHLDFTRKIKLQQCVQTALHFIHFRFRWYLLVHLVFFSWNRFQIWPFFKIFGSIVPYLLYVWLLEAKGIGGRSNDAF